MKSLKMISKRKKDLFVRKADQNSINVNTGNKIEKEDKEKYRKIKTFFKYLN
jgi:hypothetical protein